MMSLQFFKKKASLQKDQSLYRVFSHDGLHILKDCVGLDAMTAKTSRQVDAVATTALVEQLEEEGLAVTQETGVLISWEQLYSLLENPAYFSSLPILDLPPIAAIAPILKSQNSLADLDFAITIGGWADQNGRDLGSLPLTGAAVKLEDGFALLGKPSWVVLQGIATFHQRADKDKNDIYHRMAWGQIRQKALLANSRLDDFLYRSVVLTPEKLDIDLRRADIGGTKVVEVAPGFAGAPSNWLEVFDKQKGVPDRYDFPTAEGILQILITPQVKTVLEQIKRFEKRRVAGGRAEAFVINPFAALGEDAASVIDPIQFENAREKSGLLFDSFTASIQLDAVGYPEKIGILIESASGSEITESGVLFFENDRQLEQFIQLAERNLDKNLQFCGWCEYEFELLGDTPGELDKLKKALEQQRQHCRGVVMADDMGLGKTIQLLTVIAWAFEKDPNLEPALIVAPVSLLENWEEEARKFFNEGALPILTVYGDAIKSIRVPRANIDEQLKSDGLVKFLMPGWRGKARLVLTTYETLRDLEFSFAEERWSIMVCDEAQRIKNPSAMVTRAAKKQNVRFKVACTGTPVENTLADLWCLFDFVQPGLLGALNEFGRRYRKPIEAQTDEEKARVDELRQRINPQVIRRTKAEVATELKPKIERECRITLSPHQRALYSSSIELFHKRNDPDIKVPFKNHLGLLHYLRLICTDPRRYGMDVFKPEPLEDYQVKAPKLRWLLETLEEIQKRGEKAIIFCEFRAIQRLLKHYIEQVFGMSPDIINGDTTASATALDSRQKRIKAFQSGAGFGVIILSPVAVGFGVNIQAANHVIHYTRTWNPAKEDQASDRAYRIGQTKEVFVYYPVIYADDFTTFDMKLHQLLAYKRSLAQDMLNGSGDIKPGEFDLMDVVPGGMGSTFAEAVTIDDVLQMRPDYFECFIAALWQKRGYKEVLRTPDSGDDGVDVVAMNRPDGELIQCKSSSIDDTALGWDAIKDVVAGAPAYEKKHPTIHFGKTCVTNQYFNSTTQRHAENNAVELYDQERLAELLSKHPVRMMDVEKFLYTEWGQVEG